MFCRYCGNQNKDGAMFCVFCGSQLMSGATPQNQMTPGVTPQNHVTPGTAMQNQMMPQMNYSSQGSVRTETKKKKKVLTNRAKNVLLATLGTLTLLVAVLFVFVIISLTKEDKGKGKGPETASSGTEEIENCIASGKYSEAYELLMNDNEMDEETKKNYMDTLYYDSLVASNSSKPKQNGYITDEYTLDSAGWYPSDMNSGGVVLNGDSQHPVLRYTYKNSAGDIKTVYMVYEGGEYREVSEQEALAIASNDQYEINPADSIKNYVESVDAGEAPEIEEPIGDAPVEELQEDAQFEAKEEATTEAPVTPVATPDDADKPEQEEKTYYLVKSTLVYNEDGSKESFAVDYDFDKGEAYLAYSPLQGNLMHPEYPGRRFDQDYSWYFYPYEAVPFISKYCYKIGDGDVMAEEDFTFDDKGKVTQVEVHNYENAMDGESSDNSDIVMKMNGQTLEWKDRKRTITYDSKGHIISERNKLEDNTDDCKIDYSYDADGYLKEYKYTAQGGEFAGREYWDQKAGDDKNRVWKFVSQNKGEEEKTIEYTYCYDENGCCTKRLNADGNVVTEYQYIKVTVAPDGTITVTE